MFSVDSGTTSDQKRDSQNELKENRSIFDNSAPKLVSIHIPVSTKKPEAQEQKTLKKTPKSSQSKSKERSSKSKEKINKTKDFSVILKKNEP